MHELGIATGILDSVIDVADKNDVLKVKKINVVVGKKAAIIDEMFIEAFNALKKLDDYSLCREAKINTRYEAGKDVYIDNIEVEIKE